MTVIFGSVNILKETDNKQVKFAPAIKKHGLRWDAEKHGAPY